MGRSLLFVVGIALGATAACVGQDPTVVSPTSPNASADGGGAPSCDAIVLDPPNVSFGEVRVGAGGADGGGSGPSGGGIAEATLSVRNAGLLTRSVRVSAAAPFAALDQGPLGLAPGEARTVRVSFAPRAVGSLAGELRVTTEDGCSASAKMEGSGSDALYVLSPATVDFGSVLCGASATKTLTVDAAPTATGAFTASIAAPFLLATTTGAVTGGAKTSLAVTLNDPFRVPTAPLVVPLSLALPGDPSSPRSITVSASGRGAVVGFGATSPGSVSGDTAVTLVNDGNDVANLAFDGLAGTIFSVVPPTVTITPNGSATVTVKTTGGNGASNSLKLTPIQAPGLPGAVCSARSLELTFNPDNGGTEVSGGN